MVRKEVIIMWQFGNSATVRHSCFKPRKNEPLSDVSCSWKGQWIMKRPDPGFYSEYSARRGS